MKKLTRLSSGVISSIVLPCLLLTSNVIAKDTAIEKYSLMHKQLNIMSGIIKSSVSDNTAAKGTKINRIHSTYLQGQGVIFMINSTTNSHQWRNFDFEFVMPEIPEMPMAPNVSDIEDYELEETIEHAMASATQGYEHILENAEHEREVVRELREQQRELAYQLRDVEREKRDANYQLSRATKEQKKALDKALVKLAKNEKALKAAKQKVSQKHKKLQQQQKVQREKKAQERIQHFEQLTTSLVQTLCIYGNGLKALPKDEHVSIILKSAGDKSGHRYKDSVLVFKKHDISACSVDKITAKTLLAKGSHYQF